MLDIPLISPVDTLGERVEGTPIMPPIVEIFIDDVSRFVPEFSNDSSPQQIDEVPGDMLIDVVPVGTMLSKVVIEFLNGSHLQ